MLRQRRYAAIIDWMLARRAGVLILASLNRQVSMFPSGRDLETLAVDIDHVRWITIEPSPDGLDCRFPGSMPANVSGKCSPSGYNVYPAPVASSTDELIAGKMTTPCRLAVRAHSTLTSMECRIGAKPRGASSGAMAATINGCARATVAGSLPHEG